MLKVFEEPRGDTHFFMLMPTADNLLPTLKSRLFIIDEENGVANKTAKELNPFACYETQMPHPMDFDDNEEFQHRISKWMDAEKKIKTYVIESATIVNGDVSDIKNFYITHLIGKVIKAEVLGNGNLKLIWK